MDLSSVVLTHYNLKNQGKQQLKLPGGEFPALDQITAAGSGSIQEKQKAYLNEIIEKVNDQFKGELTDNDKLVYVNNVIDIAGNLANSLEQSTLNVMLGDQQQGTRIVLLKKLDRMRAELGWNESPKLERILIERVCQTWLYLHWLEMVDTQSKNRSIDLVKHESERIERAERRYLRAVKMLATIRKMATAKQIWFCRLNYLEGTSLLLDRRLRPYIRQYLQLCFMTILASIIAMFRVWPTKRGMK